MTVLKAYINVTCIFANIYNTFIILHRSSNIHFIIIILTVWTSPMWTVHILLTGALGGTSPNIWKPGSVSDTKLETIESKVL